MSVGAWIRSPVLSWAALAALLHAGASTAHAQSGSADAAADMPLPILLTTTRQVRELSPDASRRKHRVQVRGVVIGFRAPAEHQYFVNDESGPIFVIADAAHREGKPPLELGQVVELEGYSDPGTYAPQIRELTRRVVGQIVLPPAPRMTFEEIASGGEDCQRAEIEGVVREPTSLGFTLAMGDGRVDVGCAVYERVEIERLVDARVRLQGVVSGRFNQKRQWVGARFTVSHRDGITVLQPAPPDPYLARTRSIDELLQWELNQAGRHRVKVRGVATHFQPGVALFIREGVTGLQIRTRQTQPLVPGDIVEVLGFPSHGTYSAVLDDAVFRVVGREVAPLPLPSTPELLVRGEADANLVAVRGILLESVRQQGARLLVMQAGSIIFHAPLSLDGAQEPLLPAPGSLLEIAGICVVAETTVQGARVEPRLFSLFLRSPDDVRILQQPSWWTPRRLWQALGITLLAALGILSWVWLLRRQVSEKTAALKDQTQREAILEERTRIAQELHDTLDQELVGIGLQLNAAVAQLKDKPVGQRLQLIHRLLQRSQAEVRRSVWDLRRSPIESGGLATALEHTAAQLRNGSTAALDVKVHGTARTLPALVEHHLLRIAAEAMTNAFKHAGATRIDVNLSYERGAVRLCVIDNGGGFVADQAPGYAVGHFGLIGMRERSRKIGGTFALESVLGRGTRIEIRVEQHHDNSSSPAPRHSEFSAPV